MQALKTRTPLRKKVFIGLFCGTLGLSFALFNVFSSRLSTDNHENRLLTTLPTVLHSPPGQLLDNLNSFLVDNSPFRYQLVALSAQADHRLFGLSESSQVLIGREDWLFCKDGPNAATPMANYQGVLRYSDTTLSLLAEGLQALSDACAAQGTTLVFDLSPGKDRACRDYMPARYPILYTENLGDQVSGYLRAHTTVPVVFEREALYELGQTEPVFFKYDTHWNHRGALWELDRILEAAGQETLPWADYAFAVSGEQAGDLANVSALYNVLEPESDYLPTIYPFAQQDSSVLVYGDSFSIYYMEYLGRRYTDAQRRELESFDFESAVHCGAPLLILEANERNLPLLCQLLGGTDGSDYLWLE